MEANFSPSFFKGNREKLRQLFVGTAPIVLTANGMLQSSSDSTFPFRQDRSFWYLTGLDEADTILVIDKNKEYLILPEGYDYRIRFDDSKKAEQLAKLSGIQNVLDHKEGWAKLKSKIKKAKHVATLSAPPIYDHFHGLYANPARAELIKKLKDTNPSIELLDLKSHLIKMRNIKQPEEIEAIKKAIQITEKSIKSVIKSKLTTRTTELDLSNELNYRFYKYGAEGLAFDNVVAVGSNTTAIHHRADKSLLQKNKALLIDVGAEFGHYASDISRTFILGDANKRLQNIHDCVKDGLNEALEMLKPGIVHKQFEQDMENVVGEKLRQLGLIKTIDRASVRKYFPTYTSHQLGLDAHDASNYDDLLRSDMILAVEPGIYIPEEGIGIRIEEDVRITDKGVEILTTGLSQDLVSITIS